MRIRLQAGFEPSTVSVQNKSSLVLYLLHHRCVASVVGKQFVLNVNPVNCLTNFRCPISFSIQTNCLQTSVWD